MHHRELDNVDEWGFGVFAINLTVVHPVVTGVVSALAWSGSSSIPIEEVDVLMSWMDVDKDVRPCCISETVGFKGSIGDVVCVEDVSWLTFGVAGDDCGCEESDVDERVDVSVPQGNVCLSFTSRNRVLPVRGSTASTVSI